MVTKKKAAGKTAGKVAGKSSRQSKVRAKNKKKAVKTRKASKPKAKTSKKTAKSGVKTAGTTAAAKSSPAKARSRKAPAKKGAAGQPAARVPAKKRAARSPKSAKAARPARGLVSPQMQKKLLEILLHKRAVLEGDVSSLREGAFKPSSLNISVDHMADFGTDNYDQEFNLGLVEATGFTLTEIDEAILRIQSGSFGICEGCGCSIPKARLEAIPYTRFCVACQSEKENL